MRIGEVKKIGIREVETPDWQKEREPVMPTREPPEPIAPERKREHEPA